MKVFVLTAAALSLVGCAHKAEVVSTSAAYEVRADKSNQGKAYVVVSDDLASLSRVVKPGFACGAHTYPVEYGPAIRSSIAKTVEGAYQAVSIAATSADARTDGPTFTFRLDEFTPRLRFIPGFFTATADANVELSMRVLATSAAGKEVANTTVRGSGQASEEGDCNVGDEALGLAAQKALRVSLENFVSKVINTDWPK